MPSEIFRASRLTRGNLLFPTYIEVTDKAVIRRKRSWISQDEISISITKVASVHIKTGLLWSEILIESSGGTDPLTSHGIANPMPNGSRNLLKRPRRDLGRQASSSTS